jgi:hypothetical protein
MLELAAFLIPRRLASRPGWGAVACILLVGLRVRGDPAQPPQILFASDWGTATGSSDAALRDTGKKIPWDVVIGTGRVQVVSASGLDFPSANVLQVDAIYDPRNRSLKGRQVAMLPSRNHWPVPAVGESLWFRCYRRLVWPKTSPSLFGHPAEEGTGNGGNWQWEDVATNENGARISLVTYPTAMTPVKYDLGFVSPAVYLERDRTYRIEWQIQRLSVTTFDFHVRIYDSRGALLYGDEAFVNRFDRTESLANNPPLTFRNVANLAGFQMGTSGAAINTGSDVAPAWYYGSVAVCSGDWCGPYRAEEGR